VGILHRALWLDRNDISKIATCSYASELKVTLTAIVLKILPHFIVEFS
jgi:hypothetical protein